MTTARLVGVYDPCNLLNNVFAAPVFERFGRYFMAEGEPSISRFFPIEREDVEIGEISFLKKNDPNYGQSYGIGQPKPHIFIVDQSDMVVGTAEFVAKKLEERLSAMRSGGKSVREVIPFIKKFGQN